MAEPWNTWYPHHIDIWQGSGGIQILSDTAYRAVHNILMDMWKSDDCSIDEKKLRASSRVRDWEFCKQEVIDFFDRTEDGRITHFVQREKWLKAKVVYEARQEAAKKTNKTKPTDGQPSEASRSAKQSVTVAPRSADTLTVTSTGTETTTKTLASTALAVPAARGKLVCTLPLNQGDHEVFDADVQGWVALYPAVDVRQELRSIKGWALSNPTRRKTKSGIGRFVNSWLSRAQNEAKPGGGNGNRNHGKTAGNLDSLEQAERFAREQYSQSADDPSGEAAGPGFGGDSPDLLDGSGELLVGRH